MARGAQKIQAQKKAQEKAAKKGAKTDGPHKRDAAEKAMPFKCKVCMMSIMSKPTYKEHFQNKHPKADLPPELTE
eukprot:CFRG7933T1